MTAPTPPAARDAGVGELLPCPWCGGEAIGHCGADTVWACDCFACGAMGPEGANHDTAIAAWNRRAPLPPAVVDAGTLAAEAREWFAYLSEPGPIRPGGQEEVAAFLVRLTAALETRNDDADIGATFMEWVAKYYPDANWDYSPVEILATLQDERDGLQDALATAAQPARAVPSRYLVVEAINAIEEARLGADRLAADRNAAQAYDQACTRYARARADLVRLACGDAPADASEAPSDVCAHEPYDPPVPGVASTCRLCGAIYVDDATPPALAHGGPPRDSLDDGR